MLQRVRANKSWWGRLALCALALQLYLSFGHIHPEELGLSASAQASSAAPSAGSNHNPGAPHDDDDDQGICSICAAVSLTAHSLMPAPVTLALPIETEWTWSRHLSSPRIVLRTAANFRARAPPHA